MKTLEYKFAPEEHIINVNEEDLLENFCVPVLFGNRFNESTTVWFVKNKPLYVQNYLCDPEGDWGWLKVSFATKEEAEAFQEHMKAWIK